MREGFQLSVDGDWLAEYPDPSSYIPQFFGCGGGTSNGYFCDPALDQAMRRTGQLELADPARAADAWATVDHRVTDAAAWVPTVSMRVVELTSRRLRNYQYNPVQIQLAALGEQVRARRRGGLGGRIHQLQRVPRPRTAGPGVGQAAPQVDHLAAVAVDADRRPHIAVALEVVPERVPDPFEAWRHITVD